MQDVTSVFNIAADYIRSRISGQPEIAVILGTGLGPLADILEEAREIDYRDIPGFPQTTVEGHAGKLVCGMLGGKHVLIMKGRFHLYEGYEMEQVIYHIRVFKLLGISQLLVTNAAGGINLSFAPGDLMLITDHISFFAPSPLRGRNLGDFGPRFPDMCNAYDAGLIDVAKEVAARDGIKLKEGVYAFAQGPMFETPAEIRALKILGADAVGMSTVPEVIVARHSGIKVLGISCITNMAAGVLDEPIKHDEVLVNAKKAEKSFVTLVRGIIERWPV
ncbi:MAG TPA: purine-nucleoside phosphorylase [Clostridia bacterium]|nr:purine-nucleoside phosphorylase [Clostridia bacterium]